MLRLIYREHAEGNVKIQEIIERENDMDGKEQDSKKIVLVETEKRLAGESGLAAKRARRGRS
jgi:hypothetical protein